MRVGRVERERVERERELRESKRKLFLSIFHFSSSASSLCSPIDRNPSILLVSLSSPFYPQPALFLPQR